MWEGEYFLVVGGRKQLSIENINLGNQPKKSLIILFRVLKIFHLYLKTWISYRSMFVLNPANPGIFI